MSRKIVIYGVGGHAREIAWLLSSDATGSPDTLIGFVDDSFDASSPLDEYPVLGFEQLISTTGNVCVLLATGDPCVRRQLAKKCSAQGLGFKSLIHSAVRHSSSVSFGEGAVVFPGTSLTINVAIARHVHVELNCSFSHDVSIGAYSTLSPSVTVCGNVRIGEGVFVGAGATIINGSNDTPLVVGDNCYIGAGACVTRNTQPNLLYTGVPARPVSKA